LLSIAQLWDGVMWSPNMFEHVTVRTSVDEDRTLVLQLTPLHCFDSVAVPWGCYFLAAVHEGLDFFSAVHGS